MAASNTLKTHGFTQRVNVYEDLDYIKISISITMIKNCYYWTMQIIVYN